MGQGWKYRPGDIVRHQEYDDLVGVIVQPLLVWEVDDSLPLDEPNVIHEWYLITWVITPENKYHCGRECEAVLVLVFRPIQVWGHTNPSNKDREESREPEGLGEGSLTGMTDRVHEDYPGQYVPEGEEFDIEF